jgi:hypothetical protein
MRPADDETAAAYAVLDPLVERYGRATQALFPPRTDPDPLTVAEQIVRVLALPRGQRPFRTAVDLTQAGVERVNAVADAAARDFVRRMGFEQLLSVAVDRGKSAAAARGSSRGGGSIRSG